MDSKPFWRSKTFWLNLVTFLIGLFGYLSQQPWMSQQAIELFLTAIGALNILLRFLTDQPIRVR